MKPSGCKNIIVVGNQIHTTFFSPLKLVRNLTFDWTVNLQIFLSSLPITFHQIITNLLAEGCDLGPAPFYRSNSNMTPLGQRQHQHPDGTLHETLTSETAPSRVLHAHTSTSHFFFCIAQIPLWVRLFYTVDSTTLSPFSITAPSIRSSLGCHIWAAWPPSPRPPPHAPPRLTMRLLFLSGSSVTLCSK